MGYLFSFKFTTNWYFEALHCITSMIDKRFFLLLIKTICIKVVTCQDDTDQKIHYKKARTDDYNFFELEQVDINGKTVDFDRFSGGNTIVTFEIGKKGQSCEDITSLFNELKSIHKLFPYGVEFVIVPDARYKFEKKCPDVLKAVLADKGVNYLITEPKEFDEDHPVYDYLSELYFPKKIEDKMWFIVTPEGDVELHYDLDSPAPLRKQLKRIFRHIMNPKPGWQEF